MAVIMSYFEDDGKFWMTASGQRKRIPAIRRDPRVVIVITSPGTSLGLGQDRHLQGHRPRARRRRDEARGSTRSWPSG